MSIYERIIARETKIAVIGLGYVGLPIAVAFSKKASVIGFDTNCAKIDAYMRGYDVTQEIGCEELQNTSIDFTTDDRRLKEAAFIVISVPTPINSDHTPDLSPVIEASTAVGRNITKGTIIVYESTVYPGCTDDICIPILEEESGMKCGIDFYVGYSPERINPGDKTHRFENICKIISACDDFTLSEIKKVYEMVVEAGTYAVSNIKTAEAIKVVENSQRDINIAFMNELAMAFDKMEIDTNEVVDGMNTKWNALGFRPGLVGGHCIGVDPYYFTYEAEKLGYHSQIVINGRIVNENMGSYVADAAVNKMILVGMAPIKANVAIFGMTFKENCADVRNSKVMDVISRLRAKGIEPIVVDPLADIDEVFRIYGIEIKSERDVINMDCIIVAVAHDCFRKYSVEDMKSFYKDGSDKEKVLIDVKGIFNLKELELSGMTFWRL